jgi:hypothetical protein
MLDDKNWLVDIRLSYNVKAISPDAALGAVLPSFRLVVTDTARSPTSRTTRSTNVWSGLANRRLFIARFDASASIDDIR